jgi:hypothetical protein
VEFLALTYTSGLHYAYHILEGGVASCLTFTRRVSRVTRERRGEWSRGGVSRGAPLLTRRVSRGLSPLQIEDRAVRLKDVDGQFET